VEIANVRTAVLLAGGSARRVGIDKRLLTLGGRTLLSRNLAFLRDRFERVAVSVSVGQDLYLGDAPVEILPTPTPVDPHLRHWRLHSTALVSLSSLWPSTSPFPPRKRSPNSLRLFATSMSLCP